MTIPLSVSPKKAIMMATAFDFHFDRANITIAHCGRGDK
jgi:hypothetical protein